MAKKQYFLIIFFSLLFSFGIFSVTSAATLKISPGSGQYNVGSNFTVELRVDTGGVGVASIEAKINYDPSVLEYKTLDFTGSLFEGGLGTPQISPGSIVIGRGTYKEGGYIGETKVAALTFKSLKAVDSTNITIDKAYSEVGKYQTGENLLTVVQNGSYVIKLAPAVIAISRGQSTIKTDKTQALADGKDKITLTITVRDSQGNVIKDKKPIVGISGSDNKLSELTLKDNDWIATLTSTFAEEKIITVKIDQQILLGTIKVTFTPLTQTPPLPEEFLSLPEGALPPEVPAEIPPSPPPAQPAPSVSFWGKIGQPLVLVLIYIIVVGGGISLLSTIGYLVYSYWQRKKIR